MKKKRLILLVILLLIFSSVIYLWMSDRSRRYKRLLVSVNSLKEEADRDRREKVDLPLALSKYEEVVRRFEVLKDSYPEYKPFKGKIDLLLKESQDMIDAIELFMEGESYYYRGKYEEAINTFNAIKIKYKNHEDICAGAKMKAGFTYSLMGNYGDALKLYQDISNNHKNLKWHSSVAEFLQGNIYSARADYEKALAVYDSVINKYKGSDLIPSAFMGKAVVCQGMGKYDEAVSLVQEVVDNYPHYPFRQFVKVLYLDIVPVGLWNKITEYQKKLPSEHILLLYTVGEFSDEEFLEFNNQLGREFEDEALFYIGVKYHMNGNFSIAKQYYKMCLDTSQDKDFIYPLAKKALEQISR